jgi:hypothetical protein
VNLWADVAFSFRVQTQAFELVMYEYYHKVAQAQRAPEGRLISCRTIFALYNDYLTPYMLQTIKTVNGTLKCYADFKAYKQSMIKILLYNNQDKITKDIASLLM